MLGFLGKPLRFLIGPPPNFGLGKHFKNFKLLFHHQDDDFRDCHQQTK
jgi:hypothetical protein